MALQHSGESRESLAAGPVARALGLDGVDVIVGDISEHGFMAETDASFPLQAFVRLKLPGVGAVYARIISSQGNRVSGEFVTPMAPARLQRTLGFSPMFAGRPAMATAN